MSRWPQPTRPVAPIAAAAAILGIWWLVAHNGGSGWVQALGDVVFGTLAVGILGPAVVLARVKVTVVNAPTDGTAGLPTDLFLEASSRVRVRPCEPPGREGFVGPVGRNHSADGRLTLLPEHRDVRDTVTLDIESAAPFALQWWTRRVVLPLPSALHIAPRRGWPESLPMRSDEDQGVTLEWALADVGQTRGARPYGPGDSRRQIHWAASAHAAALMVRERERPLAEPVTVEVVLPSDPLEAERVAERAFGTVAQLLESGSSVLLSTLERTGPVIGRVADRRGAGRRLARAVARPENTTGLTEAGAL
jgi:uncharacterized protein (DUF58 family)